MAKDIIVEKVTQLSQQEGLNDSEIGEQLGYARGSIQRIRRMNNIPTANKENRKDVCISCLKCGKKMYIRRNENPDKIYLCSECESQDSTKINRLMNDKTGN